MNRKKLKSLVRFNKRLKTLGVNGLKQVDFVNKLTEMLKNGQYKYAYRQELENITVASTVLVADIRKNPHVKNGFRPKDLKQMLEANDMEYIRFNYLGNPFYKKHLNEIKSIKDNIEYFNHLKTNKQSAFNEATKKDRMEYLYYLKNGEQAYRDLITKKPKIEYLNYLKTNENAKKDFRALYTQFRFKKIICLICYCQTDECHRFWLKEALIQAKREFLKIETDSETEYKEAKIIVSDIVKNLR